MYLVGLRCYRFRESWIKDMWEHLCYPHNFFYKPKIIPQKSSFEKVSLQFTSPREYP